MLHRIVLYTPLPEPLIIAAVAGQFAVPLEVALAPYYKIGTRSCCPWLAVRGTAVDFCHSRSHRHSRSGDAGYGAQSQGLPAAVEPFEDEPPISGILGQTVRWVLGTIAPTSHTRPGISSDHAQPFLRSPDPELPLRIPATALGAGLCTGSRPSALSIGAAVRSSLRRFRSPRSESAKGHSQDWSSTKGKGLSTKEQQYDPTSIINEVRGQRRTPGENCLPAHGKLRRKSARLLQHWRHHNSRSPPVFLPGRSGGDCHLAYRSRTAFI